MNNYCQKNYLHMCGFVAYTSCSYNLRVAFISFKASDWASAFWERQSWQLIWVICSIVKIFARQKEILVICNAIFFVLFFYMQWIVLVFSSAWRRISTTCCRNIEQTADISLRTWLIIIGCDPLTLWMKIINVCEDFLVATWYYKII